MSKFLEILNTFFDISIHPGIKNYTESMSIVQSFGIEVKNEERRNDQLTRASSGAKYFCPGNT